MSSQPKGAPKKTAARPAWILPVAVVALAAIIIGLIIAMNHESNTLGAQAEVAEEASTEEAAEAVVDAESEEATAPTEVESPEEVDLTVVERRDPNDLLAIGAVDAPVTLIVFSDYQCTFCARWSDETLPVMMEQVEAGNLRIEWRDVNIFGPASERAAKAAYAAAIQGAYWEYHQALTANGQTPSESQLSEDSLVALAGELGLDTDQFQSDMNSETTAQEIAMNQQLGLDLGVLSTPAFLLGGQPLVGAQPTEVFVQTLNTALAAQGVTEN